MEVANKELIQAKGLKDILRVNIKEEEGAIQLYRAILDSVRHEGAILYETIEDILKDEQKNKEELERLQEQDLSVAATIKLRMDVP